MVQVDGLDLDLDGVPIALIVRALMNADLHLSPCVNRLHTEEES